MPALRITGMLVGACLLSQGLAAANDTAIKLPQTMHAAAIDRAGGPEVITLHTLPVPKPQADEVLIAVNTAGVAIWDVGLRRHPQSIKHSAFPLVLGTDGAGIVAAVGAKVQGFKVGEQVYSYSWDNPHGGFYAEYVAVCRRSAWVWCRAISRFARRGRSPPPPSRRFRASTTRCI